MSDFINNKLTQDWLDQFSKGDRLIAIQLLRSLRLVSSSKAESGIRQIIDNTVVKESGPVALFSVTDGTDRYGSEDRLGHMLESLSKEYHNKIFVEPKTPELRDKKFKHLVFVDDLIGSGTRLETFWKTIGKSERSWLSAKFCKLWIITYAQNIESVKRLRRENPYFARATFLSAMELSGSDRLWDDRLIELCSLYGKLTFSKKSSLGFGGVPTNLIFEWNAPNNSPAILWSGSKYWQPLFPRRAIPTELRKYFINPSTTDDGLEVLWSKGQQRLSLNLIDEVNNGLSERGSNLLIVLGLLAKGVLSTNLHKVLFFERSEITILLSRGRSLGFIDNENKINNFGRELLNRYRKKTDTKDKQIDSVADAILSFYPKTYKGFQRV